MPMPQAGHALRAEGRRGADKVEKVEGTCQHADAIGTHAVRVAFAAL